MVTQLHHECWHVAVGQRRMVTARELLPRSQKVIEVALPSGRVFAMPQAATSETMLAPPSPISRRVPRRRQTKIQLLAPRLPTLRYRPSPSPRTPRFEATRT